MSAISLTIHNHEGGVTAAPRGDDMGCHVLLYST